MQMHAKRLLSVQDISKSEWNLLVPNQYPFLKYEFLSALEESNCATTATGWTPVFVQVSDASGKLLAALPIYLKEHSYGEYVFDWQWANAFQHYGREYYPKLLTAIPFTPATGPRILLSNESNRNAELKNDIYNLLNAEIQSIAKDHSCSSWHILFIEDEAHRNFSHITKLMKREDVQFHWHNFNSATSTPYNSFDDYLDKLRSSKRKQVRRERRIVADANIEIVRRTGIQITKSHWDEFIDCYRRTYLKRSGHLGYLNQDFFELIAREMSDQIMLATAYQEGSLVACALFFFDDKRLYGRYWGAVQPANCLHFELCYYQGIEFAIERNLEVFDPGTQGEHKLVRGFEPVKTQSLHWIADKQFSTAIENYLQRELEHTNKYRQVAMKALPFKRG